MVLVAMFIVLTLVGAWNICVRLKLLRATPRSRVRIGLALMVLGQAALVYGLVVVTLDTL